jgi:hypothetical protein
LSFSLSLFFFLFVLLFLLLPLYETKPNQTKPNP